MAKYVEESVNDLVLHAATDNLNIDMILKFTVHPADLMYYQLCFHITQSVEKQLKTFIISKGQKALKIHNLTELVKAAGIIDKNFLKLEDYCRYLNTFVSDVKYSGEKIIGKSDMNKILRTFQKVNNFKPLLNLRNSAIKDYEIVYAYSPDTGIPVKKAKRLND